jgi:hypothetical protein
MASASEKEGGGVTGEVAKTVEKLSVHYCFSGLIY